MVFETSPLLDETRRSLSVTRLTWSRERSCSVALFAFQEEEEEEDRAHDRDRQNSFEYTMEGKFMGEIDLTVGH